MTIGGMSMYSVRTAMSALAVVLGLTSTASAIPFCFTPIIVPGAPRTGLTNINNLGQTVGFFRDNAGVDHGFLLSGGSFTTVEPAGATASFANGINDSGQIVGQYTDASGTDHGFLFSGGTFTPIDVPGAQA